MVCGDRVSQVEQHGGIIHTTQRREFTGLGGTGGGGERDARREGGTGGGTQEGERGGTGFSDSELREFYLKH